jgi:alpha-ribazole phosphatase/probable phosphoglycerate mutase
VTVLYLIRHGQTTWNAERRLQGQRDSPLSEKGAKQADAVARRLAGTPLSAIYASDLSRARDTAEIVNARHRLPLMLRKDLREVNLGEWEGRTVTELERDESEADLLAKWRADSVKNRPPGGERLEELQTRVVNALEEIVTAHPDGEAAVVTHGGVVKAAVSWILGLPLDHQRRFEVNNASITRVSFGARGPYLEGLNDISHWDPEARRALAALAEDAP